MTFRSSILRRGASLGLGLSSVLLLGGCATYTPDGGLGIARETASRELRQDTVRIRNAADMARVQERVNVLLRSPLRADAAVQIALLNNRGLQAAYNELGMAEVQFVQAALPPSPTISLARLVSTGGTLDIERQLLVNILGLATLPQRRAIAEVRFTQAQLRAAEETLRVAGDTRRAYYRAVASGQLVTFLSQATEAAKSASEMFKRLGETGAANRLDQAREHVFYADVAAQLARARLQHRADRERLIRLLGLWDNIAALKLPSQLPALPGRPLTRDNIEREALNKRIDLRIARLEVDGVGRQFDLTSWSRFLSVLEVRGILNNERSPVVEREYRLQGGNLVEERRTEIERTRISGLELEFQVPLDLGEGRMRHAREGYLRAVNRLVEKAVNVRSESREAYQRYRGSYDFARHYQGQILPLRQIIADESLLRYNAMLTDVFPLLAEARARIAANATAIEARRDFWIANTDLQLVVIGGAGSGGGGEGASVAAVAGGAEVGH
ncbi:TolC family protein [Phreatobacter oligotrophus]|uniref:Outer membrane protein TolC n=1 Tax=Phreatobacter oligotrophus TaxID=1122261 RepID=A0A2T4YX04_9HYPH|nr:TolC family protein [Phreatobacter oligotrophus]PTM49538.1 outer membrane protein TolC [Phreatobacter oligotrophus]